MLSFAAQGRSRGANEQQQQLQDPRIIGSANARLHNPGYTPHSLFCGLHASVCLSVFLTSVLLSSRCASPCSRCAWGQRGNESTAVKEHVWKYICPCSGQKKRGASSNMLHLDCNRLHLRDRQLRTAATRTGQALCAHRMTRNSSFSLLVALVAAAVLPRCPAFVVHMSSGTAASPRTSEDARRSIVVVGLNGAQQRTIIFKPPKGLRVGDVNRASSVGSGIGGKGQNVCVALRTLATGGGVSDDGAQGEVDVTLAHFAGGKSGEASGSWC